jgi:hypothetical protein
VTKVPLIAALMVGGAFAATPASAARISINRALQICEVAATVLQPSPKSAKAEPKETQVTDTSINVYLRVQKPDDGFVKVLCQVDRETGLATLTPSTLT